MIYEIEKRESAEYIFANWQETLIWSCLQGVMGHIYANDMENPTSAMAILGDFCFFAGTPDKELIAYKPEWCKQDFIIAVPQNDQWAGLLEDYYGDKAKQVVRYAIKKEPDIFDKSKLNDIVESLPSEYTIKMIDEKLFNYCRNEQWCRDLVSQFADYQIYNKIGLGVVILKDGVPVSGASSYSAYLDGIEIEVDTKKEYQRKGLALVCGARLILECLDRGLYPSWDAQNLWSVALAEKLGYHFDYAYNAYEIQDYQLKES
ncbi:MAG: GNAT family N-acetyltransferase [Lachnospiraceae bacterium]|nr:GNAT family N-acetyltransferase [Lachnospiraceae bacterium]